MANKEFVQLLKRAKVRLNKSDSDYVGSKYICFAINNVSFNDLDFQTGYELKKIINVRLGDVSVDRWLVKHGHITRHQLPSKKTKNKIQAFRHAWVDELIREFS